MNSTELGRVLARIAVADKRNIDEITIAHWNECIGDLPYAATMTAITDHFRNSTDYLMPAHLVRAVTAARRLELPATMSPEAPEDCGAHRWMPDGTCLHCTTRPALEEARA